MDHCLRIMRYLFRNPARVARMMALRDLARTLHWGRQRHSLYHATRALDRAIADYALALDAYNAARAEIIIADTVIPRRIPSFLLLQSAVPPNHER